MLGSYKEDQSYIDTMAEVTVRMSGKEVTDFLAAFDNWRKGHPRVQNVSDFAVKVLEEAIFEQKSAKNGENGRKKWKNGRNLIENRHLYIINEYLGNYAETPPESWDNGDIEALSEIVEERSNGREF